MNGFADVLSVGRAQPPFGLGLSPDIPLLGAVEMRGQAPHLVI